MVSPRWWPPNLPTRGHRFSPAGGWIVFSGEGLHPLAGGRLGEPVALLAVGDDHVRVMQEPVDGRGRHRLWHQLIEPGRVDVRADRDRAFLVADAADALFRVVDAAYEKRSLAISSNIHPAGFDELMPKTMATATVDRLLHHAHVIITDGQESYRLAQATAGKGVKPLT